MPGSQQSLPTERLIVSRMEEGWFDLAARSGERRPRAGFVPAPELLAVVPRENGPPGAAA
jgi:hypothetical protein